MYRFIFLTFVVSLVGCDSAFNSPQAESSRTVIANAHGGDAEYVAVLRPLNAEMNRRGVTGKAEIIVSGGDAPVISFDLDARGLAPGITHIQHVHAADACPTSADDTNRDGVVDLVEGVPVYGGILINLDDDLSVQGGTFPMADRRGKVDYYEAVGAGALIADIRSAGALGPDENLNLDGRHIVVHGVAADTELPPTVQSIGSIPAQVTLPVACGEIRLVR